jgi:nucleoid-associated protein YgaU
MRSHRPTFTVMAFCGALLAGCAEGNLNTDLATPHAPPTKVRGAEPGLSPGERLTLAVELLKHAHRDQARAELEAMAANGPRDMAGTRLLRDMDEDPKAVLGEQNFAYTVRPGETMETLAERFLGDRLRFYILARYNNIDAPAEVAAGRVLAIPGVFRKPPPPAPRIATPAAPPPPAPPTAPVVAIDAGRAKSLRAAGLESLNRGQINRSVNLLRQAAALDPTSPLIKRDLARAQRIQAGVHR